MKHRLIVVDDHTLFRFGLTSLLREEDEFEILDGVANGKELLQVLGREQIDLVLMDLNMPVMNGFQALAFIKDHHPDVRCLVISMFRHEFSVSRALDAGAHGVISKCAPVSELKLAIRKVVQQGFYFDEGTTKVVLARMVTNKHTGPFHAGEYINFSEKEITIIQLIVHEYTTVEIAEQVFLSPRTIEGIRLNIMEKAGVKNSAGLVLYAVKNGLVEI